MTTIFIILIVLALLQPELKRFYAAVTYSGLTAIHDFISQGLLVADPMLYFLSAGLNDLIIIGFLSLLIKNFPLKSFLSILSIMSIVVNLIGMIMWFNHVPLEFYVTSCITLYSIAIITMWTGNGAKNQIYRGGNWLFGPHRKRAINL